MVLLMALIGLHLFHREPTEVSADPKTLEVADEETIVEPDEPGMVEPPSLKIAELDGLVEIRRGAQEEWLEAREGQILDPSDSIRTAPGATAELVAGDHLIELLPATDVRVEELTVDLSRILLGTGMVAADARLSKTDGRRLQVDVADTDVTAATDSGLFRVSSQESGLVAVGAEEGRVQVAARGSEVVLRGGEGTLIRPGEAPEKPSPLPESLLLRVAWPTETETNKTRLMVSGRTAAGALVFVAGRPVEVDERGRFRDEVALRDGRNRVGIEGMDVAGNHVASSSPVIVVDTRGSKAAFETEGLWGE